MDEKHSADRNSNGDELLTLNHPLRKRSAKYDNRIKLLICIVACASALLFTWSINEPHETHHQKAIRILKHHPLIDGHNDLLALIRVEYGNHISSKKFKNDFETGPMKSQFDLPRALQGHMGGAFWSAFLPCPANTSGNDFPDSIYNPFVKATLEQIDTFHRLSAAYPKYFTLARSAAEAKDNFFRKGKFVSPLIIEGLHQIGNSLSVLRLYHQLGVRYATLNWNCHNRFSDAAVVEDENGNTVASKPLWGGISNPAGRDLIREMNRLGMIVDLAHVSVDTMRDVLVGRDGWEGSVAPPIFSHSSAKAICPHPRNVPDDVLKLVKKRNSVVMVNFLPDFISCKDVGSDTGLPEFVPQNNSIDQVVKHITHIGDLIGYDHVGLGSDFDGMPSGPRGLEDVSKFPDLVAKLLDEGIREKDIVKIIGGNILRVWDDVDRVAARMQKIEQPIEDDNQSHIPGFTNHTAPPVARQVV